MADNDTRIVQSMDIVPQSLHQALVTYEAQLTALFQHIHDLTVRVERIERHLHLCTRPSTAGTKLASIPELIEPILLHLPIRDLLLVQRVSRTFKQLVDNSTAIQRALFFAPEPAPTPMRERDVRMNPLLADRRSYIGIPLYNTTGGLEPRFMKGVGRNPLKFRIAECEVVTSNIRRSGAANAAEVVPLRLIFARLSGTFCYGRAVGESTYGSWRKMYLTQPPLHPVGTMDRSSARGHPAGGQPPPRLGQLWPWKIRRSDGTVVDTDAPSEYDNHLS